MDWSGPANAGALRVVEEAISFDETAKGTKSACGDGLDQVMQTHSRHDAGHEAYEALIAMQRHEAGPCCMTPMTMAVIPAVRWCGRP